MRASTPAGPGNPAAVAMAGLALVALPFLAPSLVAAQADGATCFWPDGSPTGDNYLPCGSGETPHSTCCSRGWTCLSNGLCMAAGQDPANLTEASIVQGGCTDRNWTTMDCPSWCTDDEEIDLLNRAQPIRHCPGSSDMFYCELADDHDDCDEEEEILRFPGTLSVMTTVGVSTTASSTPSATDSAASGSGTGTETTADSTASTSGAGASSSIDPNDGSGDGDSGGGGPDPLAIGLGVGIGVGGLGLVVAIVFFILWRRRGRKAAAAAAAAAAGDTEGGAAGEKSGMSPSSGTSELPATLSKNVHEASTDAMGAEAPAGDHTLGRAEAPPSELRHEMATAEGIQGRHELVGSEVAPQAPQAASPVVHEVSPLTASPTTPSNITRKPLP